LDAASIFFLVLATPIFNAAAYSPGFGPKPKR